MNKNDGSNCKTHMTVCLKYFKSWVRAYTLVRTFYDTEENIQTGNKACFFHIFNYSAIGRYYGIKPRFLNDFIVIF